MPNSHHHARARHRSSCRRLMSSITYARYARTTASVGGTCLAHGQRRTRTCGNAHGRASPLPGCIDTVHSPRRASHRTWLQPSNVHTATRSQWSSSNMPTHTCCAKVSMVFMRCASYRRFTARSMELGKVGPLSSTLHVLMSEQSCSSTRRQPSRSVFGGNTSAY